jgi:hypothetical protein
MSTGSLVFYCECIDLSASWIDDEPKQWRCRRCGGTQFEGVHRDYVAAGIQPGTFTAEIRPDDE